MVHINAIELIDKFIKENNVRPMKKWSLRNINTPNPRYASYKTLKEKIRNLLNLI